MINENSTPTNTPGEDEFLTSLRIDQSYVGGAAGVRKVLLTVPVRKPVRTNFSESTRTIFSSATPSS